MKKWMWAIPVVLIAVTAVAVGVLNFSDVKPEDIVLDDDPADLTTVSPVDAATRTDTDPSFAGQDFVVLEETDRVFVYVTRSTPREAPVKAYNVKTATRELGNGWTYAAEVVCGITFSRQYDKLLTRALGEGASAVYYLRDKADCAAPAQRSRSSYVVEARATAASGEAHVLFFDPKTKALIGEAE